MYDTRQTEDRQSPTEARADRNARLMMGFIALIVALAIVYSRFAPPAPQQPAYYRPDPTPFVVETQHIEVFSRNCIGWCPGQ